ncbi:tyrosine-type recombinase/integrase [Pseudoalteromonas sp. DY56-GL79]|uniref:tyrosine-type recombinase/integrase n=1 Tax=Pseudoalteromonas sp. DY56-GL79 TaxID=2967131 RepID=UPI00352B31F9
MARKLFIKDEKRGVWVGQFPPSGGWQAGRKGVRRTLCKLTDIAHLDQTSKTQRLVELYEQVSWEIKNKAKLEEQAINEQKKQRAEMSFLAAANMWLSEVKSLKNSRTYNSYKSTIDYYRKAIPDHPLKQFERSHNIRFLEYLQDQATHRGKKLAAATQNYHMRQLQIFITWAYDNELFHKQIKLKKPAKPKKDMETYDIEHLRILKAHITKRLEDEVREREILNLRNMQRAFYMATNSLMRIGAIDAMKLEWIDMEKRVIRISSNPDRSFVNKKLKHPIKPINDELYNFLKQDLKSRNKREVYFLDNGKGQPWYADRSGPSKYASKICKECNLPKLKPFHWGMRATMITYLLNNGANIKDVQELADHDDIQTTIMYHNSRTVKQRNAVDAIPKI